MPGKLHVLAYRTAPLPSPPASQGARARVHALEAGGNLPLPRSRAGPACWASLLLPKRRAASFTAAPTPPARALHRPPASSSPMWGLTGLPAGEGLSSSERSPVSVKRVKSLVSPLPFRNTHAHGSHYNPIMQQPALLTGHVTLPAAQPLNVGVAHVMRQQPTSTTSSRKSKQHQSSARWVGVAWPGAGRGGGAAAGPSTGNARLASALALWKPSLFFKMCFFFPPGNLR